MILWKINPLRAPLQSFPLHQSKHQKAFQWDTFVGSLGPFPIHVLYFIFKMQVQLRSEVTQGQEH